MGPLTAPTRRPFLLFSLDVCRLPQLKVASLQEFILFQSLSLSVEHLHDLLVLPMTIRGALSFNVSVPFSVAKSHGAAHAIFKILPVL